MVLRCVPFTETLFNQNPSFLARSFFLKTISCAKLLQAENWSLKTRQYTLKVREINDRLMMAERAFTNREGLAGRPWYKHMVSDRASAYQAITATASQLDVCFLTLKLKHWQHISSFLFGRSMHRRIRMTGAPKHSPVSSRPWTRPRSPTQPNPGGRCSMRFTGSQGRSPRLLQSLMVG